MIPCESFPGTTPLVARLNGFEAAGRRRIGSLQNAKGVLSILIVLWRH